MAIKEQLYNRNGEEIFPMTTTDCVVLNNGKSIKEEYATKKYADEAAADILNSSPEQLQVINTLGSKLANDDDLANAVTETIAEAKMQLFIDMWNEAGYLGGLIKVPCAYYDDKDAPDNKHPFYINGIYVTYEEAIRILQFYFASLTNDRASNFKFSNIKCRTYFPFRSASAYGGDPYAMNRFIVSNDLIEVVVFTDYVRPSNLMSIFMNCSKLKKIYVHNVNTPPFILSLITNKNYLDKMFYKCSLLESVKISQLSTDLSLESCPLFDLESFNYLITNATNTAPITITVHPDVYVKLTDEENAEWYQLNQDAIAKQITFATL